MSRAPGFSQPAVGFALGCCDVGMPLARRPRSSRSAPRRAAQRLDDAFRSYLAERGAKPVSLAEVSGLVAGVVSLRLTSEAVLDLWDEAGSDSRDDRTAARGELLESTAAVEGWYETLAVALAGHGAVPAALAPDEAANARLVEVVRRDLGGESDAVAIAVRILWTGDHLDAARRLQSGLVAPARTVTERAMGRCRSSAGSRPSTAEQAQPAGSPMAVRAACLSKPRPGDSPRWL